MKATDLMSPRRCRVFPLPLGAQCWRPARRGPGLCVWTASTAWLTRYTANPAGSTLWGQKRHTHKHTHTDRKTTPESILFPPQHKMEKEHTHTVPVQTHTHTSTHIQFEGI